MICSLLYDSKKKIVLFFIGSIVLISLIVMMFFNTKTYAGEYGERNITSVCIQEGDSIWSIAQQYYTNRDGSMEDYVKEIKETNGLTSYEIHTGNYLCVPYYERA